MHIHGDENAYIYGNDGTIEGIKYNYLDNVIKFNIGDMSFDVSAKIIFLKGNVFWITTVTV